MRTVLLLLAAFVLVLWGTSLLRVRRAPWTRPDGPTTERVFARIHASGVVEATHGPSAAEQRSILSGPARLRGTRALPNAEGLQHLLEGLQAFAKPRQGPGRWNDLPHLLEIEIEEDALTAWLTWLLWIAQRRDVGLTNVALRRMPSGRLIPLDLPQLGEWEGPRPGDKEEPRTYIKLHPATFPPREGRQVLKVSPFTHYVSDAHEIYDEDDDRAEPPPDRYSAELPSIAAWRTSAGRRLLADRLRHVRALLTEDMNWLDSIPLDVIVEPVYTRFADMPATVVLDVLEGLRDLPGIRLQYEAMIAVWW